MSVLIETKKYLTEKLSEALIKAKASCGVDSEIVDFTVETPPNRNFGDLATNIAMVNGKTFKMAPRAVGEKILSFFNDEENLFEKSEIVGPGFINFTFNKEFYARSLKEILDKKENYGKSDFLKNEKIMVEFVSANPTGPMHIGNARGGALGDSLSDVLKWAGADVYKEFYVNDAGNQIERFGLSLEARYLQQFKGDEIVFPEDGYHGEDIKESALEFIKIYGDKFVDATSEERRKALVEYALPININKLKTDLSKYRIEYDRWFLESDLYKSGEINELIELLKEKGLTYEKDGAIWYKATEFGGEKDEVIIRANGHPTYFAADIAYHKNKFLRGFDKCIDVWGADHHGHVARMKGAMNAIGLDGDKLDIVIMQMVRLISNGEVVRVSKRTGKSITLADLLDEVPLDAARFFFNMREANTHLDFDLSLAVEQSNQNPVYYVEYAHARICSILSELKMCDSDLSLLKECEEKDLIFALSEFENTIIEAAKKYDPSKITKYLVDLATLFHKFYNNCRVICDDKELSKARVSLISAVRTVIANGLSILKINAMEKM